MKTTQGSHIDSNNDLYTQVRQEASRQKERSQALCKQVALLNATVTEPFSLTRTSHLVRITREQSVLLQAKNLRIRRDCQSVRASLQIALAASRLALDAARVQLDASRLFNVTAERTYRPNPKI